jgi:hypothetical protein
MRSVAKHSYVKGASGKSKAKAHVNYIQHRSGPDRDEEKRMFFDQNRDGIDGREVKEDIDNMKFDPIIAHKLMLSPGVDGVDIKEYTRHVMKELGDSKGLDLDWKGVVHKNTDHDHAHVIVLGLDKEGHRVRFNKDDYQKLRELGDNYLERNHYYDRYLDREISDLLKEPDYRFTVHDRFDDDVSKMFKDDGNRDFSKLDQGQDKEKDKDKDPFRDMEEWKRIDEDFKKYFRNLEKTTLLDKGFNQYVKEQQGRLSAEHGHYMAAMDIQRLEQLAEKFPEREEHLRELISDIREFDREQWREERGHEDMDAILGYDTGPERGKDIEKEQTIDAGQSVMEQILEHRQMEDLTRGDEDQERQLDDDAFGRGER